MSSNNRLPRRRFSTNDPRDANSHSKNKSRGSLGNYRKRNQNAPEDGGGHHIGNGRGSGFRRGHAHRGITNQPRGSFSSSQPRPEKKISFMYFKNLTENLDTQNVMLELSNPKNGFATLLESNSLSNDFIVLLVKLMKRICECTFVENKTALLTTVLESNFMNKLTVYITGLTIQNGEDKRKNQLFWDDSDEFWDNLLTFSRKVQEVIPTYCSAIEQLLSVLSMCFERIEKRHSVHISDDIKNRTKDLLFIVEKTIEELSFKKVQAEIERKEPEPPNNYREIDIIPNAEEVVTTESPFLRENIIDRAFDSVDHYLDIQFRLLREDFVAPLRRGITTYLSNQYKPKNDQKKLEDVRIYQHVRFVTVETVNECDCYKLQFTNGHKKHKINYEKSKRFLFGSLICLTMDKFQTLLFGKIVNRDVNLLNKGQVVIGFQEKVQINFNIDYIMVESSVYFEPYYQVLGVLQKLNADNFPMEKYIIRVETDSCPPKYLTKREVPIRYTFERTVFNPLNFPESLNLNLNESQMRAYKAALSNEFCIIQGPPGTGKTFLGLKIVHTLLKNKTMWWKNSPILVICFTNHALDQFLEGLLSVTNEVIRVGGQSKNEVLKDFNLKSKRRGHKHHTIYQMSYQVKMCHQNLRDISELYGHIESCNRILDFSCFAPLIENYEQSWFANASKKEILRWLVNKKEFEHWEVQNQDFTEEPEPITSVAEFLADNPKSNEENNEDVDEEIFGGLKTGNYGESLLTLQMMSEYLNKLRTELSLIKEELEKPENEANWNITITCETLQVNIWETETNLEYLTHQLQLYQDVKNRTKPKHVDMQNPFRMSYPDRWQLYFYWTHLYAQDLRQKHHETSLQFQQLYRVYSEMRDMEDTQIMSNSLVLGMTTTGAARLRSSLQALKSPIVIVEEAAEVLESHIVAALTNNCQHLILIGDHLQLKPGAADYRIETKYKLGVSLFERMVRNNIQCYTLDVQHRMRPEISQLVKPHIYPNLKDHESTLQRPHILGISKCLYFIDHQESEEICPDEGKKNVHESTFLIALARHLILNGYKPEQITILCAYLAQFYEMLSERNQTKNKLLLKDVRISVLDNYQGEESDIILLSLVRSNNENKAGFLRIQNRVCVALSRARDGMYIMGNMSVLLASKSENEIWQKINEVLKKQLAIGSKLTLRCQVHNYRYTEVSKANDFYKLIEGGCDSLCEADLACEHVCKRLCHIQDRDHSAYNCLEKCNRNLCNTLSHLCQKHCYEECGPCMYIVPRALIDSCGHIVEIPCYIDPSTYKCLKEVLTKLPCGHETNKPCSVDPFRFTCPFPCDVRVEPCGHACIRKCHVRWDPDHLEYKCMEPCARPRVGCCQIDNPHTCTKLCYQECEECMIKIKKHRSCGHVFQTPCCIDVETVDCQKPCKRILPCGHVCTRKCSLSCSCDKMVEKVIDVCQHTVKIKCSDVAVRAHCKSKFCPRLLSCGHKCLNACKDPCTEICKTIVDCNIPSPCGHYVKKIPCYLTKNTNDDILLKACTEPCFTVLKCKHPCTGTCGKCRQSRLHKRCTEKCGVPLVCNHECAIPCREACKPCTRQCEIRCPHSKCSKQCGAPCTPCSAPCSRKCEHQRCQKACGEICNVKPCTEKCKKLLKCKHPCVGFCGDPCPHLCRECDKDELTETFFGTEDEEDATFVLLADCKHVLEHSGLETWLDQNSDRIQFKTCPKCKQVINSTQRYSEYIKQACQDVMNAKMESYGNKDENEALRKKLEGEVLLLKSKHEYCSLSESMKLMQRFPKRKIEINDVLQMLETRLQRVRNKRAQHFNKMELNAIQVKIQTFSYIIQCFRDDTEPVLNKFKPGNESISQVQFLIKILLNNDDHITDQEIEDLQIEIKRLFRIVQFERLKMILQPDPLNKYAISAVYINSKIVQQRDNIQQKLFAPMRYSDFLDETIKNDLQNFATITNGATVISEIETMDIVRAIGLSKGHWFKCPNGHPYVIGECGGAMQTSKCFCGAAIGGANHRLLPTNEFAGEIDGATRHAFIGPLH
ncbi:NFX1-type zinc finger-containing protein 1-like isoform X2 [Euwallacea fornicatus]|uniref:NFX1-type zinc finger-containing protein 1-like isoform X2 n=1 Tax=Euwallacea fornicatus TaxID=995702 RepID=UPI00338F0001